MKIHKRIWIGLGLAIVLLSVGLLAPQKALAFTISDFDQATYKLVPGPNKFMGEIDATISGQPVKFIDRDTSDNDTLGKANYKPNSNDFCPNTILGQGGDKGITLLTTFGDLSKGLLKAKIDVDFKAAVSRTDPCGNYTNVLTFTKGADGSWTATVTSPPGGEGGSVTGTDEACYSLGWELSWVACPVITAAQTTANAMYRFVEDQLKFTVSPDGKTIDSLGDQREEVKSAWNNFRILVSGLVVILLLVMVISQAIGSGPFDAYTIRKMLPRVVAGVILIQISWPLFSFVINFVDNLGRGLADLMYAPFGGSDALNLNSVMGPFTGKAMLFSWVSIPALVIFGVVAPFIVLGLILTVMVAIFVGFLTLLFRKIIIILTLIFVPVALIAWMMPNDGLRKYWKLWWDNFIKALMMFPLIIAIIAAGRIFAKIGSGTGGDFVGFFIVLVGFFGPLFILPKTFKWGGTAMQLAGNALTKAQTATLKKPREFLGERQKGLSAERTRQSQERFARNEGFNPRRPWRRPIDLVKSGRMDPTLWGRRRQQAQDAYVHAGEETYQKDIEAARSRVLREGQDIRARGGNWDRYFQMVADGVDSYEDERLGTIRIGRRGEVEQDAARKQTAILGSATNWRFLEDYYQRSTDPNSDMSSEDRVHARKFFDDNVSTIMPKMPHVYQGYTASADATGATLAGQHGVEVESILGRLSADSQDATRSPEDRASAQRSLVTYLQNFHAASQNPNITLDNGALRAVKGFLDSADGAGFRDDINNTAHDGRAVRGMPTVEAYDGLALDPTVRAELDRIRVELAPRIDSTTGTLSYSEQQATTTPPPASGGTNWRPSGGSSTPV